jgi:hypothetical protein
MEKLMDNFEVWTSRASIARPYVARYGVKKENGVHYYVKFPDKSKVKGRIE